MREAVIVSAVRTPTGKFLGALKAFTAPELGALVVAEAVRRAGIDPAIVDECIMGNVVAAGLGQNPARQAALDGGLPDHVGGAHHQQGLRLGTQGGDAAAQGIATGDIDIAVAGGMESMSNCPYLLPRVREGLRMGHGELVDSMIHDGLWCAFETVPHGQRRRGRRRALPRDPRGAGRVRRAQPPARRRSATEAGWFKDEILPDRDPAEEGRPPIVVDRDESIRADTTVESLAALKPAFKKDGTVTAGNAPGVNDGAVGARRHGAPTVRSRSA